MRTTKDPTPIRQREAMKEAKTTTNVHCILTYFHVTYYTSELGEDLATMTEKK